MIFVMSSRSFVCASLVGKCVRACWWVDVGGEGGVVVFANMLSIPTAAI